MRSTWLTRAARAATAVVIAAAVAAPPAAARPRPGLPRSSGTNLFALTFGVLNVNRIFCGISNVGNVCVDPTGSPVVGGGFWPKGTPDQYIFNSGLQIAGTIPANAGFVWAGDTVGAFFMDPRGDQNEGSPITNVYSSIDPGDQANWPTPEGVITDSSIFAKVLLGRNSASQEDLWVRTWDGDPSRLAGRTHPMGVLVEERGMGWNYPTGNEDIIYFVYTFTNVTASDRSVYDNPTIPNTSGYRDHLAAIGQQFQTLNEGRFSIAIPDSGYAFTNLFAAFFMDCDVGDAGNNFSTPIIPYNLAACYQANFLNASWVFPPDIFGAPFTPAPGFIGVKYLRSPVDSTGKQIGLTIFSNTLNSATGYPDPVGVIQLYRYLSGTSSPALGDNPCNSQGQQLVLHYCYLAQTPQDTRFFQSSGPFTLLPGHASSIVVAYMNAAPLPTAGLAPGSIFTPGIPTDGVAWFNNQAANVRPIERVMGFVKATDRNGDSRIEPDSGEVTAVPRSLLDKAEVAQSVFNAKFLLPFAPNAPGFFLIPGDNQVTIVWKKSTTEDPVTGGDPYYAVASDPTSPLYDPNFRHFDVEGYRIYRGRNPGALELVAQFDYSGTSITDYTGSFAYTTDLNGDGKVQCAPELQSSDSTTNLETDCPVAFDTAVSQVVIGSSPSNDIPLVGTIIQVPAGGRIELHDGSTLITKADTAVTGGGTGFPALSDGGVTFAYVDRNVRNEFTYYYSVTAFDVNSLRSGPSSLESARLTQTVTPRPSSNQTAVGQLGTVQYIGANGQPITVGALPTLDPSTGEFSGPMPPADGIQIGLAAFLPEVLANGSVTVTIDSIVPGMANGLDVGAAPLTYFLTGQGAGAPTAVQLSVQQDAFSGDVTASAPFPATTASQAKASIYSGDSTFALYGSAAVSLPGDYRVVSYSRGDINGDPGGSAEAGPRWWTGSANENTANPNAGLCIPSSGGCAITDTARLNQTSGRLAGVDVLMHVQAYGSVPNVPARDFDGVFAGVTRAADIDWYWGANGHVDSVIDVTHHVPVPFSPKIRASWGFLIPGSFAKVTTADDGNNALLTWSDIGCVPPITTLVGECGGVPDSLAAVFSDSATLSPIAAVGSAYGAAPPATGNGFILYLNGNEFLMQMAALPSAGTVWHARFFAGSIVGGSVYGTSYAFREANERPPAVPGLRLQISYTGSTFNPKVTTDADLSQVHTVPDPYYVTDALEQTPHQKIIKFVHLPAQAIVRIYSVSGVLVQVLTHNDPTGGSDLQWDLRNRNNQFVASGVYFYAVETPDGKSKVGRFTIVNYAP